MTIDSSQKIRNIAGENIILLQGKAGEEMSKVVALNETSLFLWNHLCGKSFSIDDVVSLLTENYEIDAATASNDAKKWVEKLKECNLIVD